MSIRRSVPLPRAFRPGWLGLAVTTVTFLAITGKIGAAGQADSDPEDFVVRVDVNQILLNVTVLDPDGRVVPDLRQDEFQVEDDGAVQRIQFFEQGDVPVSIGLILDNSRSIGSNRTNVVNAALQFLGLLGPADEVFVVHFSDEVMPVPTARGVFTTDRNALERAIRQLRPVGITRLYDAVGLGLEYLERGQWQRKALIVLGDGGDNGSRTDLDTLEASIESSDAPIFPIGLVDPRWRDVDPRTLERFAEWSGGQAFFPAEMRELPGIWSRIATLVHSQYTIGYAPSSLRSGFHEVRVRVPGRDVRVYVRRGYRVD